jgi:cellulose synthase/poly-beta-1,6-N-acetylglucosamine synthase-like glycosyltransferase
MHVIPGPCGLFRYNAMGSLKEGLMHQYFRLFQRSSHGLIVGNVELVEDRIPGTLLSFPFKEDKVPAKMPRDSWPRTGFVHEAIFYIEAEKPLSQLVKQRRRWLNGTFATYLWMLTEGLVTKSNQEPVNRFLSWCLIYSHQRDSGLGRPSLRTSCAHCLDVPIRIVLARSYCRPQVYL